MAERKRSRAKWPLDHAPEAVTQARLAAGLSKTQLADGVRVSLSLISEIEKGTRNAGPALIDTMAGVLGCPPDQLKRREGQQPATRLAVVCVQCSELWEPDHVCPSERTAELASSGSKGAAA
jgi:transcriptional regulator with XRE-family HTH domain